jgi:hypothetical protein
MPLKSYWDKSAVSRNASASSSVVRVGSVCFIAADLPFMHESGTDRSDEAVPGD